MQAQANQSELTSGTRRCVKHRGMAINQAAGICTCLLAPPEEILLQCFYGIGGCLLQADALRARINDLDVQEFLSIEFLSLALPLLANLSEARLSHEACDSQLVMRMTVRLQHHSMLGHHAA